MKSSSYEPSVTVSRVTLRSVLKLAVILSTYITVFVSMIQLGFFLFASRSVDKDSLSLWSLFGRDDFGGLFRLTLTVCTCLAVDLGLLCVFAIQHTGMTQRKLVMTSYWNTVHYNWEIDKAVYNLMTAVALQVILSWWQPVGIYLWKCDFLNESPYNIQFILHIFAWAAFYGTNLMVDLPDLIGLNQQVLITCPTKVVKSPELRHMIENQRHMGFLPLTIILLVHPCMSLDRFVLAVGTLVYTYVAWRSASCYPYATAMKQVKKKQEYTAHNGNKYRQD